MTFVDSRRSRRLAATCWLVGLVTDAVRIQPDRVDLNFEAGAIGTREVVW